MRALVLAALVLVAAGLGCGPGALPPGAQPATAPTPRAVITIVVHNLDVAYAATATLSYWQASTVLGVQEQLIPGGGEGRFPLPVFPDGLEVDTTAWPAQTGGAVWGSPDYRGARVFHISYPTLFTWIEH